MSPSFMVLLDPGFSILIPWSSSFSREHHREVSSHKQCECYRLLSNLNSELLTVNAVNYNNNMHLFSLVAVKEPFIHIYIYVNLASPVSVVISTSAGKEIIIQVALNEEAMFIACTLHYE